MTDGYSLRPPRSAGKAWHVRASYMGLRFEVSTRETAEAEAREWAARYWEAVKADPVMNAEDPRPPGVKDTIPEAVPLGVFEAFLMANFALVGEAVVRLATGRAVTFHACNGGYRQAQISWEGRAKRVLEHRVKFLLRHRWLPRSVDHRNRIRHDNALSNLRPATPRQQSANRGA